MAKKLIKYLLMHRWSFPPVDQ